MCTHQRVNDQKMKNFHALVRNDSIIKQVSTSSGLTIKECKEVSESKKKCGYDNGSNMI